MAVTVGRYITDQRYMEAGPVLAHRQAVLCHSVIEYRNGVLEIRRDRILRAHRQTPAAAHTFIMIDLCLAVLDHRRTVGTYSVAGAASYTGRRVHARLAVAVLFHLTRSGTAAHTDILQGAAEACHLMALKMRQRNKHIRIHDRMADLGLLHILPVDRNQRLVRPFQTVADDHMASRLIRRKTVYVGCLQMIERILPASHIQRITVRQKRLAAKLFHIVRNHSRIVGPQECQIAVLPEMNLDRRVLVREIDLLKPRRLHQTMQLLQQVLMLRRLKGCKIYICFLHHALPPFFPYNLYFCLNLS